MGILAGILTILVIIAPIAFICGVITLIAASTEKSKSTGLRLIIFSLISFVIGFGGCLLLFNGNGY